RVPQVPRIARVGGVAGTRRVTGLPRGGPVRMLQLVRGGLVGGEGRLGIFVVRPDRLHPLPPAVEERKVLAVLVSGRGGIMRVGVTRMVVRVVAEDLRRIVIHRHGSSLLVIMGGRAGSPGSCISSSVSQMTRDF